MEGVRYFFVAHPKLNQQPTPIVHSVKARLKDESHLKEKLLRKWRNTERVSAADVLDRVTDLCGVRVLHLHQNQFPFIHEAILDKVHTKDWTLAEKPIAYSWDPEVSRTLDGMDLDVRIKESYYTSIHYLVRPRDDSPVCCEVQVRTLFEEIWGEIDHAVNYPHPTSSLACANQLKVLARLVSTGTRLADSIFDTIHEYNIQASSEAEDQIESKMHS
jgi:putative GTP pyrophosphokinase